MANINILIVDDDLNKITTIIKTIKEVYTHTLSISQASCVQDAIENLQKKEFHLLITDLQMPIKHDENNSNDKGGEILVKTIYRKKDTINIPLYIIGLTQFSELESGFSSNWRVLFYDASLEEWKRTIRDLIFHISLIKSRVLSAKIETIYVEGPTDKKIIEIAFKHFFPNYIDRVYIDTISYGGGSSWVERQLFIWAKSLTLDKDGTNYLKAVGIFDNDEAGNKSIKKIRDLIEVNSAESKTFSIIKNCYKYSPILKAIKAKGLTFPTTIEDLVSIECWKKAKTNGWLEPRNTKYFEIDEQVTALKVDCLNIDSLEKNNFNEDETVLIIHKVKDDCKLKFCNLVCESNKTLLDGIKFQIEEVLEKLKL